MTDYRVYFGVDQTYAQLCKLSMTPDVVQAFKDAVDEDYEISSFAILLHVALCVIPMNARGPLTA